MKNKIKKLAVLGAAVVMAALALTGCGAQVTGLALQLAERAAVGERVQATLTAEYDNPEAGDEEKEKALAGLEIIWASSDEAVATVDETGSVTAVADGTATITATAGKLKAEKELTVFVPLEGIEVPATLELALNKTESARLAAKPVPENARVEGVPTFASSDEGVATVSADGTVTAVANGEAVITVTLGGKSAETRVTVTTAPTGIALEKTEGILYVGGSYTLEPYTLPEDAPESSYSYKSGNEAVATVSETGVITANSAGTAQITVTSGDGFEAVYALTVRNKPAANTGGSAGAGTGNNSAAAGGNGGSTGGVPPAEPTAPPSGGEAPTPEKQHSLVGSCWCGKWHCTTDRSGPGHAQVGQCPACGLNNGGWGYVEPNGQAGNGWE